MSDYKLKNVCDFDLAQTLECGQCFHFVKLDEEDYVLAAKGHVLHVSQEDDTVTFYDTEEDDPAPAKASAVQPRDEGGEQE